jgi:hypothetical protein
LRLHPFDLPPTPDTDTALASQSNLNQYLNVQINQFFKKPVPLFIKNYLEVKQESPPVQQEFDLFEIASAPPRDPVGCRDHCGVSFLLLFLLDSCGMAITSLVWKRNFWKWSLLLGKSPVALEDSEL